MRLRMKIDEAIKLIEESKRQYQLLSENPTLYYTYKLKTMDIDKSYIDECIMAHDIAIATMLSSIDKENDN